MGLFGKKVNFDKLQAGMMAAQATLAGDYGSAAGIWGNYRDDRDKRRAAEAKQQAAIAMELNLRAGLEKRGYNQDDINVLMADPRAAAGLVGEALKARQFGSSGGSIYDPASGQWTMAPSRHEFQGSVYDVGGGPVGAQAKVTPQYEGTQWVTPQPGTTAFGVNSFTGERRGATPQPYSTPPINPAPPAADDEWEYGPPVARGGAGLAAPRPFRRGLFGR